jgi:hypothetical protein
MNKINYNALAQVIDTTWGRSSTRNSHLQSVKVKFIDGDRLAVSYVAVVNFATEKQMIEMKQRYAAESANIVKTTLDGIKKQYNEIVNEMLHEGEDAYKSLKMKEIGANDSLEIIGLGVHNPKRTAYYRRQSIVQLA